MGISKEKGKSKAKLSVGLIRGIIKAYWEVQVQSHRMTTSVLDICEWSASQPGLFVGKSHPVPVLWASLRTQTFLRTFALLGMEP
jgi:hypothetical protein